MSTAKSSSTANMPLRIAAFDWCATTMGPVASWPETLRTALRIILATSTPHALFIGEAGISVYNDACAAVAGDRHPALLGAPLAQSWPELASIGTGAALGAMRGEARCFSNEEVTLRRGGLAIPIWLDMEFSPVPDESGRVVAALARLTDTTERVLRGRDERDLAVQELSHRIQNIFSVLGSIIGLSARAYPGLRPFAEQLRQRVYALSQAHEFVRTQSKNGRDRSLHGLLDTLLSQFQHGEREQLFLTGSDVEIDDAAATPLALLFHELATNAVKHGALAHKNGRVEVSTAPHHGDCKIVWKESGTAKPPTEGGHSGFGNKLIALSVEGQLDGRIVRSWERDGLRAEITIPAAALARSTRLRPTGGAQRA